MAGFAIMLYNLRQGGNLHNLKTTVDTVLQFVLPIFGAFVALLMVSRVRYPHITNRLLRGQRSFGHVVGVVFFFVALMLFRIYALPIAASAFTLYGPIHLAWQLWIEQKPRGAPVLSS